MTKNNEVTAKIYILRTEDGRWLGQVVLTSDSSFMSITDYGNYCYHWNNTGYEDFRKFILSLNIEYFGNKMFCGVCDILRDRKTSLFTMLFSENILPVLKEAIRKEIELEEKEGVV